MFKKILTFTAKHKIISGIFLIVVFGFGWFGFKNLAGSGNPVSYAAEFAQKGTLIVSVSGSGQVSAFDQIEIKPEVSGRLAGFYIVKDQEVKAGQLLAVIDDSAAKRAVSEAEIALESAEIALEELLSSPDEQSLLQAQNALVQAERDFEKAKRDCDNVEENAKETIGNAYEDGYSDVSTSFFKLSDYMGDLDDVLGVEQVKEKHIDSYKLILGESSALINRFVDDYYTASALYYSAFDFFGDVFRDDERGKVYELINNTLQAGKAISSALESARHMYDAMLSQEAYRQYAIASTIDNMAPKIQSDLSGIFSTISALQNTIDIIDDTISDTPDKITDAELALKSAEEKLADKKLALKELEAGAAPLDIRAQQNSVAQKQAALDNAEAELAAHYIYAPFSGVIAQANSVLEKGDNVSSGSSLAVIITKQKIVEISLNEIDIAQVKTGQKATITFDAVSGLALTGLVVEVDSLGATSQGVVTYTVKIALDTQDDRVKDAMTASAAIVTEVKPGALLVSNSAIKSQDDVYYVEAADEKDSALFSANVSKAILTAPPRRQIVEIGLSNDEFTEILSGIEEGTAVVVRTIQAGSSAAQTQQTGGSFRMPGFGIGGGLK